MREGKGDWRGRGYMPGAGKGEVVWRKGREKGIGGEVRERK